jgi:hypothetical protein
MGFRYVMPFDTERENGIQVTPAFLGAFAKLRKAIISFIMSVYLSVWPYDHLSVRMERLRFHWMNFQENRC